MLRDYIYLDIERVRSYYAQLSKGLSGVRVDRKEEEGAGEASAGINIPLTPFKVEGGFDYRYRRSSEETFSLHDYIGEDFLKLLEENGLLTDFSKGAFEWEMDSFQDGMFVLVDGKLSVVDYKYVVTMFEYIYNMMKLVEQPINQAGNPQSRRTGRRQSRKRNETKPEPEVDVIAKVATLFDQNIHDTCRIKIYPKNYPTEKHFTASANPSLFRIKPDALINLYGSIIDADWSCLLLINLNRGSEFQHNEIDPVPQAGDGKFNLESVIEPVIKQLAAISDVLQGVEFPAIAATPIAIFREIKAS